MSKKNWDFSGWATKNDIRCSDGNTIRKGAFAHCDGKIVPLMYNHVHDSISTVLGHALLEDRGEGIYAYCSFNDTESGREAKKLVQHGDVAALSIYANGVKKRGTDVVHGMIREVSLVLAGANPGAYIETLNIAHGDMGEPEEEVRIFTDECITICHSEDSKEEDEEEKKPEEEQKEKKSEVEETPAEESEEKEEEPEKTETEEKKEEETIAMSDIKEKATPVEAEEVEAEKKDTAAKADDEKTVKDVIDSMTEEQKTVMFALIGQALEEGGDDSVKHNVFENDYNEPETVLSHSDIQAIFEDARIDGSLRNSVLAHAAEYGIENIDVLFPDAKLVGENPQFIGRDMEWVSEVLNGASHSPFAYVKSVFADITEDEARAKGYIKGNLKRNEVFKLLKRTTQPTTVYKKQKLDRDDVLDITDLDTVAMVKAEMRPMLNEEVARAAILGDGREDSNPDKIDEEKIRPVVNDESLFVIRWGVAGTTEAQKAENFIEAAIRARKNYKGSGSPILFTTEDMLTSMLLLKDTIGRRLYATEAELATALRVKKIVTVPPMEGYTDKDSKEVYGVILNMADYNFGTNKGGQVTMFDDFDINYNQMIYLLETRTSGALTKPFSAIVLRAGSTTKSEEPTIRESVDKFMPKAAADEETH